DLSERQGHRIGHDVGLALGGRVLQCEMDGADEILACQHRSAIATQAKWQRPWLLSKTDQSIKIAFDARPVDQHRSQDREWNISNSYRVLSGEFGAAIGISGLRRIAFAQNDSR